MWCRFGLRCKKQKNRSRCKGFGAEKTEPTKKVKSKKGQNSGEGRARVRGRVRDRVRG